MVIGVTSSYPCAAAVILAPRRSGGYAAAFTAAEPQIAYQPIVVES